MISHFGSETTTTFNFSKCVDMFLFIIFICNRFADHSLLFFLPLLLAVSICCFRCAVVVYAQSLIVYHYFAALFLPFYEPLHKFAFRPVSTCTLLFSSTFSFSIIFLLLCSWIENIKLFSAATISHFAYSNTCGRLLVDISVFLPIVIS